APRAVVRDGPVRHPVVPRTGLHLYPGQRPQRPRPAGQPAALRRRLHGAAVLPARLGTAVRQPELRRIHWCAALTIDSLSRDPVAGKDLNDTWANQVLG